MNANIMQRRSEIKPIVLKDKDTGKTYTLEYTKRTVVAINDLGFKKSDFTDNLEKMLPLLWYGAFLKNHKREIDFNKAEELLYAIGGITEKILDRLISLYNAPAEGMLVSDDEEEENTKNASVTVEL